MELKFWPKENLFLKVRTTTLLIVVWSKTEPILVYDLLNFKGFWKNSEFQLSLNWAEIQVCFSSTSSTELKNLPKAKLMDFKSSKTFLQGPRADSCYILSTQMLTWEVLVDTWKLQEFKVLTNFLWMMTGFLLSRGLD